MTAPSTACPNCGEDVPFGRRTCEACGANVTAAAAPSDATDDEASDDAVAADAMIGTETDDAGWDAAPTAQPAPKPAPAEPEPRPPAAADVRPIAPAAAPFVPPVLREWNAGSSMPETGFAAELAAAQGESSGLAGAWLPPSASSTRASTPASNDERASLEWPVGSPESRAPALPDAARSLPSDMPPSLADMLQRPATGAPRWPGAAGSSGSDLDAPAALGESDGSMIPPSRMPDLGPARQPATAVPPEPRRLEPGRSPLFADLPFDAPDTLPGWLVAAGGGLATISFLLPWINRPDSYFSAWGLAAISNLPAFLVVFGTTALAILPSRLGDWLRHGILGLAVGSFMFGIVWNRLVGSTGGQLGVILEGTGALLLLIGGILAIVRDRGAADGPRERD